MELSREIKQEFLRSEILEKGYDGEQFSAFFIKRKSENIDDWSLEEIQECVKEFKILQRPPKVLDEEPVPQIERPHKDTFAIPCKRVSPSEISELDNMSITLENPEVVGGSFFFSGKPAYTVLTSPNNWSVKRQLEDFTWLRNTLASIYPGVIMPAFSSKKVELDEKSMKNQQIFLSKFMNSIIKNKLLRTSPYLLSFLKEEHEKEFSVMKKEATRLKKPVNLEDYFSLTGVLECDGFEKKQEDKDLWEYLNTYKTSYKRLKELSSLLILKTSETASVLNEIGDLFKALEKAQFLVSDSMTAQFYANVSTSFTKWASSSKDVASLVERNLQNYFSFSSKEIKPFIEIIKEKEGKLVNYIKNSTKLLLKKERLWMSETIHSWGLKDHESADSLYNNKELAFSKMLHRETSEAEKLKNEFAYLNFQIKSERTRVFNGKLLDDCSAFASFARQFTDLITAMHLSLGDLMASMTHLSYNSIKVQAF